MSREQFVFPYTYDELCNETSDTRYRVTTPDTSTSFLMEERKLKKEFDHIEKILLDHPLDIREPLVFDFLYHIIRNVGDKKENFDITSTILMIPEFLSNGLDRLIKQHIEKELIAATRATFDGDNERLLEARTALKMVTFLIMFFLNKTVIKRSKNSIRDEIDEAQKDSTMIGAGRKGGKAKKVETLEASLQESLVANQVICLAALKRAMEINHKALWERRGVEDTFYSSFASTALKMLESKPVMGISKAKESIYVILESVCTEYSKYIKTAEIKIVNLLYEEDEVVVDPIVELLTRLSKKENSQLSKMTMETLSVLVEFILGKTNINNEGAAVKNIKEVLCRLSEKIPKTFYTNLSVFITLYESEAYALRNALSDVLGNIIRLVLTKNDGESDSNEGHKKTKIKLLEKLLSRVTDKHAFSRSHALAVWCDLAKANVIPNEFLLRLFDRACGRIQDISANVRRKAIQLLQILVQIYYNLFVESQGRKQFLSTEEIEETQREHQREREELITTVERYEAQIKKMSQEEYDLVDDIQSEIEIITRKLEKIKGLETHLNEYKTLITLLDRGMPNVIQLLASKNVFDVLETIRLLTILSKYGVRSANAGVKKMLVLIWYKDSREAKDKQIKEELQRAYWILYLNPEEFRPEQVALNLVGILNESSLTEATSLEELINSMIPNKDGTNTDGGDDRHQSASKKGNVLAQNNQPSPYSIKPNVFHHLWTIFLNGLKQQTTKRREGQEGEISRTSLRSALTLVRIGFTKNRELFSQRVDEIFNYILATFSRDTTEPDWQVIKEIALIAEKTKDQEEATIAVTKALVKLLFKNHGTQDNEWFCAAEQIINMIFTQNTEPEPICEELLKNFAKFLVEKTDRIEVKTERMEIEDSNRKTAPAFLSSSESFERKLIQLLFVAGHVAIKLILHVDAIENQLKRLKRELETKEMALNENNEAANELDKIHGGIEAIFERRVEDLHKIAETRLVQENSNLLGFFTPILKKLVEDIINRKRDVVSPLLERVTVLALCKFMCVSSSFCKENINLLFALKKKCDPVTKANIIIAFGDLIHRYPTLTEPYNSNLYTMLQDPDVHVRKTTMMVITHLVLNDMLKIKGEICEVAALLNDPEPKIQNLVKLFFHELHEKDPKIIYNLLPEAIGRMSKVDSPFNEEHFQVFAKNIMQYLEKDRFSETLVEKLCQRMKLAGENLKEVRNTSYCLSLLSFNEKAVRKLSDLYDLYKDRLSDSFVSESIKSIVNKVKSKKADVKHLIEDFEAKLSGGMFAGGYVDEDRKRKNPKKRNTTTAVDDQENSMVNEESNKSNLTNKSSKGAKSNTTSLAGAKKAAKKGGKGKKKADDFIEDSEDEEEPDFVEDNDEDEYEASKTRRGKKNQSAQPPKENTRSLRPKRGGRGMIIENEEDDDY